MRLPIPPPALQLFRHATALWTDVRDLCRHSAELAKLDAALAKASLVSMTVLSGVVLLFLATGWILLVLSLVAWLSEDWLSLPMSLLVVGLALALVTVPLIFMIKRHSQNLSFKATRRQLRGHL